MKIRVTQKQIKEGYDKILVTGYCDLYYLLRGLDPRYYTCGVYGWNSDIYHYDNRIAICTGYRPFGNIQTNRELNEKYNEKAREIYNDYSEDYDKRITMINMLLDEYVEEVLENE